MNPNYSQFRPVLSRPPNTYILIELIIMKPRELTRVDLHPRTIERLLWTTASFTRWKTAGRF